MLKSSTELHLSFSSFMNHRRHFLAQLSSELSPHLQNSRAFRSIKWRRTKRGISETKEREMSIFHFPFLRGSDGYNDLEYTELQVNIKLMISTYIDNNNALSMARCHGYSPTAWL